MHLMILNASPRAAAKSNTEKVLAAFCRGFTAAGNTCELWHLSRRSEWQNARDAFASNRYILLAMPLYVENVPGILLEFLQTLPRKLQPGTQISFLIQGGFEEAAQAACARTYVETLPGYFGCEYGGTLTRGGLFGANLLPEKLAHQIIAPFEDVGREFAAAGRFTDEYARDFAGPEHMSTAQICQYELFGCHLSKLMMGRIAKKLGCKEELDAQPYAPERGSKLAARPCSSLAR